MVTSHEKGNVRVYGAPGVHGVEARRTMKILGIVRYLCYHQPPTPAKIMAPEPKFKIGAYGSILCARGLNRSMPVSNSSNTALYFL
jgi:hypothetical protein